MPCTTWNLFLSGGIKSSETLAIRWLRVINSVPDAYMYHQQQNKWYPKGVYLPISNPQSILAVAILLAYNKINFSYYVQANLLRLKSSAASKWANKHLWGHHLFCCQWYAIHFLISGKIQICLIFNYCMNAVTDYLINASTNCRVANV